MIKILCFGKFKNQAMLENCDDYLKRINKYHKIEIIEFKEEVNKGLAENLKLESLKLIQYLNKDNYVIVLEPDGSMLNSEFLATHLESKINTYKNIIFIIGSSNGIHQDVIAQADIILSFSKLTFPHLLFRIMLVEQIYRSFKIINNERYHK